MPDGKQYKKELDNITASPAFKEDTKQKMLQQLNKADSQPEDQPPVHRNWFTPRRIAAFACICLVALGVLACARLILTPATSPAPMESSAAGAAESQAAGQDETATGGSGTKEAQQETYNTTNETDYGLGNAPSSSTFSEEDTPQQSPSESVPATARSAKPAPTEQNMAGETGPDSSSPNIQGTSVITTPVILIAAFLLLVAVVCFFSIRKMFRSERFSGTSIFPLPGDTKPHNRNLPQQNRADTEDITDEDT